MDLTDLKPWEHDAADIKREEEKRVYSPSSFFYSQGHALILAAKYFNDKRLLPTASGGVARKHRHRIHLALFGQIMASFEYLLKDFIAQIIDSVTIVDSKLKKVDWIQIDIEHVLSTRETMSSIGSFLIHSTMGWHDPEIVNKRYISLFKFQPIKNTEVDTLNRLWILRHSVAHNAGLVIAHDAGRGGMSQLSNDVVSVDSSFLEQAFEFLCNIAKRLAVEVGDKVLLTWLDSEANALANYKRDKQIYIWLKLLATYVESRAKDLPKITKSSYTSDFNRALKSKASG